MKGISPIVATTLLIFIVVSIGLIFTPWVEGFVVKIINFIETSYEQNVICVKGKIVVEDANFNCKNLGLVIKNDGLIVLRNITLFVIYENDTVQSIKIINEANSKERIHVSVPVSSDYKNILVKTHCSRISYELDKNTITAEC